MQQYGTGHSPAIKLFWLLVLVFNAVTAQGIEEPDYEVLQRWESEEIEIRHYAPRVMAVTEMAGREDDGFRVLAGYIFGGNTREQEIAMTRRCSRR